MNDELLTSLTEVIEQPALPEAELNLEAPADAEPQARDDSGKFAAKEPAKDESKVEDRQKLEAPKQEPRTIPLAAHLEERRALKAELDAMKAQLAALQNPPKAPAPEPVYEADPKAYTDHKVQSALEKLQALEQSTTQKLQTVEQTTQQTAEQTVEQQIMSSIAAHETSFRQANPDYDDALMHIRRIAVAQMRRMNPDMPEQIAFQTAIQQERAMAIQLARQGRNPVDTAYALAQDYGYQRRQPAPALELPKVPAPRQLPPDQTLGTGSSEGADVGDDTKDPFEQAFGEMFKPRKSA